MTRAARGREAWLAALVLLAILVPTACILWFTYEAAAVQTAAATQTVLDAYRGQLRLIRQRLHEDWLARAAALDAHAEQPPAEQARALLQDGAADGVVILDATGRVVSPRVADAPDVAGPRGADAHRLAADYLAAGTPAARPAVLLATPLDTVWQMASPSGRVIGLYRHDTVHLALHGVIDQHQSPAALFTTFKPEESAYDEAIPIGPTMPGWRASFTLLDTAIVDGAARARVASYWWVGLLGAALFAATVAGIAHSLRQRLRLARMQADLVAAVSHELRTPLASMRLLVEGLLRDETLDPAKTRDYLGLIAVENDRLSRLIENFLTFSRLERGRLPLAFADADPVSIAGDAVRAMRERLHPGCEVRLEIADGLPMLRADADALVTALLNLLDNAYKYTPAQKEIVLRVSRGGRYVVFAVQDNGIGVPLGEQRRIFRRFHRVDRELSSATSGVGLGLSIVREIVRAHGGDVHVASRPGAGSTFTVRLPIAPGAAA